MQAEELESGTYDELKVRGGFFADLVKRQQIDEEQTFHEKGCSHLNRGSIPFVKRLVFV